LALVIKAEVQLAAAMERTRPPAEIRRELRAEVGFGCPVDDCGSPYLTWHHFDPPWRERERHEVGGMIALCLQHHKEADSGAFTEDQLRQLKANPFLERIGAGPAGHFSWRREQMILEAGGGFFVRCPVFLEMAGRPIVWLSSDGAGHQLLNLDIWDADGQLIFAMRDNDWTVLADLDDVEAPPSARSLIVRAPSKEIRVSIEFAVTTIEHIHSLLRIREEESASHLVALYKRELARLVEERAPDSLLQTYREMIDGARDETSDRADEVMRSIRRGWSGNELVRCDFRAQIPFPFPVHVTGSKITLPGNNVISGAVVIDCGTAIALQ
jgi:hypothetical protein